MSKKKESVMAKERQNFIFGNEEEGVPGCISRGISEATANKIFDEMTSFARYAFNKSHAAAYAVVSFQTAYLKHYYPVQYMAALMTSVIDNTEKCAEYLVHCREVKIPILPPSVNSGEGRFTTEGDSIRYGMYAIKAIGRGVIDMIVRERTEGGPFTSIRDFITRTSGKEMNKRAIENLIKAGALDCLGGTRRQFMQIYAQIADQAAAESKAAVSGQLSLFDLMAPELRKEFEIRLPDVGEFGREQLLFFEKEVLGVYLSGHPLEEYEQVWRARITAVTSDFSLDEETGVSSLENEARVTVGGMITGITRKYTKNNKSMAFLMLEDLLGTVEVVVFPNSYEKYRDLITEDNKVFIDGHVDAADDRAGKLICDRIYTFAAVPKEAWIAFPDAAAWLDSRPVYEELREGSVGEDSVCIYLRDSRQYRRLPDRVLLDEELLSRFRRAFGGENLSVRIARMKR